MKLNNTQAHDANDIDVLMPTYNLMECRDIYSKPSGSLWQYYRDELAWNNASDIIDF